MGSLRLVAIALVVAAPAFAQTYGLGRTPTADELRTMDISVGPTGEELPVGRGTAKEGALLYRSKGCVACHGAEGVGGLAPALQSKRGADVPIWQKERILPLRAPFATIVWDFINRGMPVGLEGTLTPDEVYSVTAWLLHQNGIIAKDAVIDAVTLSAIQMPNRHGFVPDPRPDVLGP